MYYGQATAPPATAISPALHIAIDATLMRYHHDVVKRRYTPKGSASLDLHSYRLVKWVRREFHLINIAFGFLRIVSEKRFERRRIEVYQWLSACEKMVDLHYQQSLDTLASFEHERASFTRYCFGVQTLSEKSSRFARLIQQMDATMEMLIALEYYKRVSKADRQLVIDQFFESLALMKNKATGKDT
jgi:hypothetical protein